jgi:galactokinase
MINIFKEFTRLYSSTPLVVRSSGRINLIGEHTDYNMGYVLPAAIDKSTYIAVGNNLENKICMYAYNLNEHFETDISQIQISSTNWANYVLGVINQFQEIGKEIKGINILIYGDVPLGSGLSSSASLLCATVFAINELHGFGLDKLNMVKMAQMAEHTYAGVKCGIMDMFASMYGKNDSFIKLDCKTNEYEYIPCQLQDYKILLLNTNVSHSLASSEYNTRRQECEYGVELIKKHNPEVQSLRDATLYQIDKYILPDEPIVYKRCKYVVEENLRLQRACDDLEKNDLVAMGKKMFKTHDGLKDDYEVSCAELDFLVNAVKNNANILGSRMMGGGFGGCTINIVHENYIDQLLEKVNRNYQKLWELDLGYHLVALENGTELITEKQYA